MSHKEKYLSLEKVIPIDKFANGLLKEMAYKGGFIIGFFNPPEKNLPVQKRYTVEWELFNIEICYKRNRPKSWLFCWFLSPSFDDHVCAYACVSLPFG